MCICKAETLAFTDCFLLLDISVVSVVIVIIAICDMPRHEFSLRERVYIHNTYMKSRKWCSETRRKFRITFPGRPVPNPSTIRRLAKWFYERGSLKNRNVNRRRHVFTEETLDEIGERLTHNPQKSLKRLSQETGVSVPSVQRATKLLKLKPYKIPVVHALHQPDPNKRLRFCNWALEKVNWRTGCKRIFFSDEAWFYLYGQVCS